MTDKNLKGQIEDFRRMVEKITNANNAGPSKDIDKVAALVEHCKSLSEFYTPAWTSIVY
jgi:hypothetical protein